MPALRSLVTIPISFYSEDGKRISRLGLMFLLMLCVAFFTPGLITLPPTDRDESSFAQASKQMVETGDYIDIKLQDEPRYKKPIGIYWLQTTAVRLLNPNHLNQIWAYRIPSLIGATASVLLTAEVGATLFTPAAGLLAAMMLAGSVLLNVEARLAKTDAALLACIMSAMLILSRAYMGKIDKWISPFIFWSAIAVGILVKGPIILLPVGATLIWLRVSDKQIPWFAQLKPFLGLVYVVALVAPWLIAISVQSHGAFLHQSAGNDMLAKLWQGQNRGLMPPGLHLMALPLAFFPFAIFVLFAAPDAWKQRQDRAIKFCLGWIIPTWFVFELSLTKLPHYVLPTYPALAILTAKFLLDGFPSVSNSTRKFPIVLTTAAWLMIGFGFASVFSVLPAFVNQTWSISQLAAGVVLMLSQGIALVTFTKDKSVSIMALTVGFLIFMTTTMGQTLPNLDKLWVSREIAESVRDLAVCSDTQIISLGYHEPSLVFLAGTHTLLPSTAADAARELKEEHCRVAVVDDRHKQDFLDSFKADTQQPESVLSIDGLNSGHGSKAALTVFELTNSSAPPESLPAAPAL